MMRFKNVVAGLVMGCMLACAGVAEAQDNSGATGRKIVDSYKDAVVKVRLVVQQKMMLNGKEAQSSESKSEATGTVVDPSGLVLVSLSSVDPSKFMDSVMKSMGQGMKIETRSLLSG